MHPTLYVDEFRETVGRALRPVALGIQATGAEYVLKHEMRQKDVVLIPRCCVWK
jgi:hypothetical protein